MWDLLGKLYDGISYRRVQRAFATHGSGSRRSGPNRGCFPLSPGWVGRTAREWAEKYRGGYAAPQLSVSLNRLSCSKPGRLLATLSRRWQRSRSKRRSCHPLISVSEIMYLARPPTESRMPAKTLWPYPSCWQFAWCLRSFQGWRGAPWMEEHWQPVSCSGRHLAPSFCHSRMYISKSWSTTRTRPWRYCC